MPIKTNLEDLRDRKLKFGVEIQLVSRAYFAPEILQDGMIRVFPWDTEVTSWTLRRMRQPRFHAYIADLAQKLADWKDVDILRVPIGDINTVNLVGRAMAYPSPVHYHYNCPHCPHVGTEVIKVPDALERKAEKPADYPGWDETILLDSQDEVRFRPMEVRDLIDVEERSEDSKRVIDDTTFNVCRQVVAVGGGTPTDMEEVVRWYRALSPSDAQQLLEDQKEAHPELETRIAYRCDACDGNFHFTLDFNTSFFRPDSPRRTEGKAPEVVRPGVEGGGADPGPDQPAG